MSDWSGEVFEVRLGTPGHGGFCVARHEGRVLFVRHGLPGELVRALVTEDRGGSFCRAEAIEILEASSDRVDAICPVSGPGGAGCCDFSFATPEAQRGLKAAVVAEQLRRLAGWEKDIVVEPIPVDGAEATRGWRSRMRLAVDADGRAGVHRYRGSEVITDLRCPQPMTGAMAGIADRKWTPGADLVVAVDGEGQRHIVELAPPAEYAPGRRGDRAHGRRGRGRDDRVARGGAGDRRSAVARRSAASAVRAETVVEGSGRAVQYVEGRRWELAATGFWQPHYAAAQAYSDVVAEWAYAAPGSSAWDLYSGVGVFAARVAEQVGPTGSVHGVESARSAVADGAEALRDLPWIELRAERVERWIAEQPYIAPEVVVLDPPRAGAGKEVIAALAEHAPRRIVHIGCDPASFARDINLYRAAGYMPTELRAFDAFPGTHHVECLALLEL
ncbi:class I SAM-dependent RNA methyltransferase [Nocardia uniformis]|uniref:Class I SAM-dependent RNA methyltransferase n=1 Tax=Nocardia uniformis TaxID=53432 RepID=A0A849BY07_9NOCA|nr:TRAM domain-containing protein [Nocardia uniformis]NNH71164.1 class I SAM-dependent RNA methyltransferase [Nocardia uniformis]